MLARRRAFIATFIAVFILLDAFYFWHKHSQFVLPISEQRLQLWQHLHPLLERHTPKCPAPTQHDGPGVVRFDAINEIPRKNFITNADEIEQPMQEAHDGFVKDMRKLKVPRSYVPETKGIVSSAGGTYLPTFVVSLKLLRRTGTTLPVELFLKDQSEYEPYICDVVLPPLNVKCLVLSDIMKTQEPRPNSNQKEISGFQLKAFAMLFSSFEAFLWLDADCVPLHDAVPLLTSAPFTTTGLVTWPDFFANTAAPVYFNISGQSEPPSTTRQSSESGMILFNKKTHFQTLLLSAYYNYHGPDYYYPLLDQGAPGAGDKDTFLHAATALNAPFYAVSESVIDLGNITPWNDKVAINAGYIQADPIQDYALTSAGKWRVTDPTVAKAPRAFFIHAGAPEFNPGNELMGEKLRGFDGNPTRLWTYPESAMRRLGFDAERMFWEEVRDVACSLEDVFESWSRKRRICEKVKRHWEAVFADGVVRPEGLAFTDTEDTDGNGKGKGDGNGNEELRMRG
ncbi:mannosyltransferase putative-domain-containing protein [Aspergillus falconensis]